MFVFVGLGNPGSEYKRTRHNAGFLFLDYLFDQHKSANVGEKSNFTFADISIQRNKIRLVKPTTYMNLSGAAVKKAIGELVSNDIDFDVKKELWIIHDDVDLAPGQIKIKESGGDAGHNGIKDITATLGSPDFVRIRIGVGRPSDATKRVGTADHVLDAFTKEEIELLLNDSFPRIHRFIKESFAIGYQKAKSRLTLELEQSK